MTINNSLNISLSGLKANQGALNVVSHNIANMNTEGYVRQRVNFAEVTNYTGDNSVSGQIASLSGVKIAGITTATNDYLNNYFRTQNSIAQGLAADAGTAAQVADLLDPLKTSGLEESLTEFFNAANSLNQNPTDYSLRINFVEKAKYAANNFGTMYSSLEGLKTSKIGDGTQESANISEAGVYVSAINTNLEALVKVNKQISGNAEDASLKTQRDQILSALSEHANITTVINPTGTASVYLGDTNLISNNEIEGSFQVTATGTITFTDNDGKVKDVTEDIKGGKLGGTLNGLTTITNAMDSINTLAAAFAQTMNDIQKYDDGNNVIAASYDRENDILVQSTEDLFETSDGSGVFTASNIKINDVVYNNPDLVAAARVDSSVTDWEKSVGNGDNALAFYTSQSTKIADLGYLTFGDYLTSLSTKAALNAATKANEAATQGSIVEGIQNQILAESGVNLDEELANMIMYRQAYNASARVFSTCVEIYDTLVALGT